MRVHSVKANNYGPFSVLEETLLGPLATIVGQNDVGKSNILKALQLFFESRKIEQDDVHDGAASDEDVVIEVAFTGLPDRIELEEGVKTTFQEEMLLDRNGLLRIRKTYPRGEPCQVRDRNSHLGLRGRPFRRAASTEGKRAQRCFGRPRDRSHEIGSWNHESR